MLASYHRSLSLRRAFSGSSGAVNAVKKVFGMEKKLSYLEIEEDFESKLANINHDYIALPGYKKEFARKHLPDYVSSMYDAVLKKWATRFFSTPGMPPVPFNKALAKHSFVSFEYLYGIAFGETPILDEGNMMPLAYEGTRDNPIVIPSMFTIRTVGFRHRVAKQLLWFNLRAGHLYYVEEIGLYFKLKYYGVDVKRSAASQLGDVGNATNVLEASRNVGYSDFNAAWSETFKEFHAKWHSIVGTKYTPPTTSGDICGMFMSAFRSYMSNQSPSLHSAKLLQDFPNMPNTLACIASCFANPQSYVTTDQIMSKVDAEPADMVNAHGARRAYAGRNTTSSREELTSYFAQVEGRTWEQVKELRRRYWTAHARHWAKEWKSIRADLTRKLDDVIRTPRILTGHDGELSEDEYKVIANEAAALIRNLCLQYYDNAYTELFDHQVHESESTSVAMNIPVYLAQARREEFIRMHQVGFQFRPNDPVTIDSILSNAESKITGLLESGADAGPNGAGRGAAVTHMEMDYRLTCLRAMHQMAVNKIKIGVTETESNAANDFMDHHERVSTMFIEFPMKIETWKHYEQVLRVAVNWFEKSRLVEALKQVDDGVMQSTLAEVKEKHGKW